MTTPRTTSKIATTLLFALPFLLAACNPTSPNAQAGPSTAMPPPEVSVITLQAKAQAVALDFVGQTAGSRETEVRARVAGILQNRLFVEGTAVAVGTPLF